MVREVTAAWLAARLDAQVWQAADLAELEALLEREPPFDLILLDLVMPGMEAGLQMLPFLIRRNGGRPVVIWSGDTTPVIVADALEKGAAAYVDKSRGVHSLEATLGWVLAGEARWPRPRPAPPPPGQGGESRGSGPVWREQRVLRGLAAGLSDAEIGATLGISETTVGLCIRSICRRLQVATRADAALVARQGLR